MQLSTEAEAPKQPRVRITSRCSTPDEFVAVYRQYCDERSIFIATKTPKPRGTTLRFAVTLSDGRPQIVGLGRIAESHTSEDNPYNRPGMRIEFLDLEEASRALVHRLHAARRLAAAHPPPPPGTVRAIPVIPPASAKVGEGSGDKQLPYSSDDEPTDVKHMPNLERAASSDIVLPANPFGEVADESLEGFVECSLYEEEGAVVLPPEEEVERELKWLGPGAMGTPLPAKLGRNGKPMDSVEEVLEQVESAIERAVRRGTIPPAIDDPEGEAAERLNAALNRRPVRNTTIAPPMPADERGQWKLLGLAVFVTAAVALAIGYFIWGGGPAQVVINAAPQSPPPAANDTTAAPAATPTDESKQATAVDETTEPDSAAEPEAGNGEAKDDEVAANTETETETEAKADKDNDSETEANTEPETADSEPPLDENIPPGDCVASITTKPTGAAVRLDGAMLGETPLNSTVPCGKGLLKLVRPRYESIEKPVEFVPGRNPVDIRMSRPIHELTVTSFPAGANVTVNGRSIGRTPAKTTVKGYERARVKVTKRGYTPVSKSVYMRKKSARVHSKLTRQGSKSGSGSAAMKSASANTVR